MLIAKRAMENTTQIYNNFLKIKEKINEDPKDIEKLTEIKDYMGMINFLFKT